MQTTPGGAEVTTTSTTTTKRYSSYSSSASPGTAAKRESITRESLKRSSIPRMSPEVGKRNSRMLDVPVKDNSAGSVSPKLSREGDIQCVLITLLYRVTLMASTLVGLA